MNSLPAPLCRTKKGWPWCEHSRYQRQRPDQSLPKISVITPSYQQGAYLEECIRSVAMQCYPNIEHIIIDGGSADESVSIMQQYDKHLSYWHSQKDDGQSQAINSGFEKATGQILCWLNSDDFLLPNALQDVADLFAKSNTDILYGDSLELFEESKELQYWEGYCVRNAYLKFGGLLPSHATFWKRSVHQLLREDLSCAMDSELWIRLVPGRKIIHLPIPLAVCRIHSQSKSSSDKWKMAWTRDIKIINSQHGEDSRLKRKAIKCYFDFEQWLYKFQMWRSHKVSRQSAISKCEWADLNWRGRVP